MLLIAIGANLPDGSGGDPRHTCERAVEALRGLDGLRFVAVSPWYRTRPEPRDDTQPDYCNGVARFAGDPDPVTLMAALHRIEDAFGRTRAVVNAARTLDLDLIDLNGLIRAGPPPVLPHPRAHLRGFVLRPILDLAPEWVHPTSGLSPATLLKALPDSTEVSLTQW